MTVRYEAVNAMLLNEFLKEHRTVEELQANAATQRARTEAQEATLTKQQALSRNSRSKSKRSRLVCRK